MISGNLSPDAVVQVFRQLSVKQRQGVLEVAAEGDYLELWFDEGVLVAAQNHTLSIAAQVIDRLYRAEYITAQLKQALSAVEVSTEELKDFLVGGEHVNENDFNRTIIAAELDTIHRLRRYQDGFYSFTPRVCRVASSLQHQWYATQLLLDMFELEVAEQRFAGLAENISHDTLVICLNPDPGERHLVHEARVWELLDENTTPSKLEAQSLLSRHAFLGALLSLYDRELVAFGHSEQEFTELKPDVMRAESEIVEEGLQPELSQVLQVNNPSLEAGTQSENLQKAALDSSVLQIDQSELMIDDARTLIEKAVVLLKAMDEPITMPSRSSGGRASSADPLSSKAQPRNVGRDDDKMSVESQAAPVIVSEAVNRTPKERWRLLNYTCLSTDVQANIAVIAMLAFLLLVAIVAPAQIESWFSELQRFSSNF